MRLARLETEQSRRLSKAGAGAANEAISACEDKVGLSEGTACYALGTNAAVEQAIPSN